MHCAEAWLRDFARHLDADGLVDDALVDDIVERCLAIVVPAPDHDDDIRAALAASAAANARALRSVIAGEIALADLDLTEVLSLASLHTQLGISQNALQRAYRIGFCTMWEEWSTQLRIAVAGDDIDRDGAILAKHLLTQIVFEYEDLVTTQVAESYARSYEASVRAHTHRSIRDILRGDGDSLPGVDTTFLDYELRDRHVAVLLPTLDEQVATPVAGAMCAAAECRASLVYPLSADSAVVWLGRGGEWTGSLHKALEDTLRREGVQAAISNAHKGIKGLRTALAEAVETDKVRRAWGSGGAPAVIHHRDVGLEILLLQNSRLARQFAEQELGPLAQRTAKAAMLRETLEASLRFGSHVAAAEHLQLHEHSVRKRLQKAESILGYPIRERRTELHVAARLMRLLVADDRD